MLGGLKALQSAAISAGLPLAVLLVILEGYSNGEVFHVQTPRKRAMFDHILTTADERSRRLGMDRREFLTSTLGMAASLGTINLFSGCAEDGKDGGFDMTGADAGAATLDCARSDEVFDASDYFILDMQTHHVDQDGDWLRTNPVLAATFRGSLFGASIFEGGNCDNGDGIECLNFERYLDLIFYGSDTTMAVLSGYPSAGCEYPSDSNGCGLIIENDKMALERDIVNLAASSQRMLNHSNVAPDDNLEWWLDNMEAIHEEFGVVAGWKAYTGWAGLAGELGSGWALDDPKIGIPFIQKGIDLDVPIFCCHKGPQLPGFQPKYNDARDVGVVAKMFPEASFVVYHSGYGFGSGGTTTPYDPAVNAGVNNLIKTVEDNDLGPGSNVYAELGTLWHGVMDDAVGAQHVIGKLLKHVGEDNILWGSECIWFTSPQPQIEAFKTLTISRELQERHGYPELTDERKRKILGLNAARLYGIDPCAMIGDIDRTQLAQGKQLLDGELGERRWALMDNPGPRTPAEYWQHIRKQAAKGQPG